MNLAKGEIIQAVRDTFEAKNTLTMQKVNNELNRFNKRKNKARQIFDKIKKKEPHLTSLSQINSTCLCADDLKGLIIVLKRKGDGAMPKGINKLKERWERVKFKIELTNEQHLIDQGYDADIIKSALIVYKKDYLHAAATSSVSLQTETDTVNALLSLASVPTPKPNLDLIEL